MDHRSYARGLDEYSCSGSLSLIASFDPLLGTTKQLITARKSSDLSRMGGGRVPERQVTTRYQKKGAGENKKKNALFWVTFF